MKEETIIERSVIENQKVDIQLKKLIENIEKLESEKNEIAEQVKNIYKEAKSGSFDTKVMKKLIALRKIDTLDLQEEQYLLKTYAEALQMELF